MKLYSILLVLSLCSCSTPRLHIKKAGDSISGSSFYAQANTLQWKLRDSLAVNKILTGNLPAFMFKLVPVNVSIYDSLHQQKINATYYVTPDYLSVGNSTDWARIPLTPIAAQIIADSLQCFLPTRKMVDDIYKSAVVKLAPVPMYIYRDSSVTMWQHHLIIEGQRSGKKGLIAGIKKDVVISDLLTRSSKPNRVAIYGWHTLDGKPIQPLYTGHVNWYADYSHGIRLVHQQIKVNGKWIDYKTVFADTILRKLLSDELFADVVRY